jgi:hypothetical protein
MSKNLLNQFITLCLIKGAFTHSISRHNFELRFWLYLHILPENSFSGDITAWCIFRGQGTLLSLKTHYKNAMKNWMCKWILK